MKGVDRLIVRSDSVGTMHWTRLYGPSGTPPMNRPMSPAWEVLESKGDRTFAPPPDRSQCVDRCSSLLGPDTDD